MFQTLPRSLLRVALQPLSQSHPQMSLNLILEAGIPERCRKLLFGPFLFGHAIS
jgi:hypothetical protein